MKKLWHTKNEQQNGKSFSFSVTDFNVTALNSPNKTQILEEQIENT